MRDLIVNADDFGRTPGINAGIVRGHEQGIVTSASLMVCWPAAEPAARYARDHPQLSVGLHVDLGEWAYRDGEWHTVYERADAAEEIPRQLERFRALVGRDPTHLDSHQHVHRQDPAASVLGELAARLGVPLRGHGAIRYCGDFYGQTGTGEPLSDAIGVEALVRILESLPAGVSELGCHPGLNDDAGPPYAVERGRELRTLCDPRIRDVLVRRGIRLRSFRDPGIPAARPRRR